jgi:DNA-binding transcriptional LysR family regulator
MELRQLAYFVAVAEEGHFTRAAQKTHIAQPAISRQVIQLERELGERLFLRDPAGVRLTDAGSTFLPHARAALAAAQAGRDALASLRGLLIGRLTIGTVLPAPEHLPQLLGRYRQQHPGVELRLREGHTKSLISSLARGELDFALIGLGPHHRPPKDAHAEQLSTEPVVLAISRGHRLATRRSVTLAQLRDEPMVALPHGSGQREMIEEAAASAGFTPHITAESSDIRTLIDLAAQHIGIALVPRSAIAAGGDVAVLSISRPRLRRRTFLIWRPHNLSPAARTWLDEARAQLSATNAQ